jgi:hypothetical protein
MSTTNPDRKPTPVSIPWKTCVHVCRDCFERPDGPACGGDGATVKARIKEALRDLKPGVRTIETSCLDCCPEGAFAIAITGPSGPPRGFSLTSLEQADEIVRIARLPQ